MKPGDVVERYRIESALGSGGMASVYRVTHTVLGSTHALKVLDQRLVENEDIRARFLSEGRIQSQLRHPNIASITDIVAADGIAGLVVEYVEGPTLDVFLQQSSEPLSIDTILEIMLPGLDAVGAAHARGIVHRDLKPENIILGTTHSGAFRPVILDFGIAKLSDDAGLDDTRKKKKTQTGIRMGTLAYMSPEQVRGEAVDARTDLFALGAILYELATGVCAFDGSSEYDTMDRIAKGRYAPPRELVEGLSPHLAACIAKALDTSPECRFQSCGEFAKALTERDALGVEEPELPAALSPAEPATATPSTPEPKLTAPPPIRPPPQAAQSSPIAEPDESEPSRAGGAMKLLLVAGGLGLMGMGTLAVVALFVATRAPGSSSQTTEHVETVVEERPSILDEHGYDMVRIAPGEFEMGSSPAEEDRDDDETRHSVSITRSFEIGATEVTQALWTEIMGSNAVTSRTRKWGAARSPGDACSEFGVGSDMPVHCVSWLDAVAFCNELSIRDGLEPAYVIRGMEVSWKSKGDGYRLPTEAEWEHAARARPAHLYSGTSDRGSICRFANVVNPLTGEHFPEWRQAESFECSDGASGLASVASHRPNQTGLYDMTGNVWEWVWDWYGEYPSYQVVDPRGPSTGTLRAIRGGAWQNAPSDVRLANRYSGAPEDRSYFIGFRVARSR